MKTKIIELKGLTKKVTNHEGTQLTILNEVQLTVFAGDFVAVMGPSGSGKSTLAAVMGLMLNFDRGRFYLNEKYKIHKMTKSEKDAVRSRYVGFVFQDYVLLEHLTVLDNLLLGIEFDGRSRSEMKEEARGLLKKVGILQKAGDYPKSLSGGQKQRAAIARCLLRRPKILIADEPVGALDPRSRYDVLCLLQELNNEGHTILMITHNEDDAKIATRQIFMRDGEIELDQLRPNPTQLLRRTDIVDKKQGIEFLLRGIKVDRPESVILKLQQVKSAPELVEVLSRITPQTLRDLQLQKTIKVVCDQRVPLTDDISRANILKLLLTTIGKEISLSKELGELLKSLKGPITERNEAILVGYAPQIHFEYYNRLVDWRSFFQSNNSVVRSLALKLLRLKEVREAIDFGMLKKHYLYSGENRVMADFIEACFEYNLPLSVGEVLDSRSEESSNRLLANIAIFLWRKDEETLAHDVLGELMKRQTPSSVRSAIFALKVIDESKIERFLQDYVAEEFLVNDLFLNTMRSMLQKLA